MPGKRTRVSSVQRRRAPWPATQEADPVVQQKAGEDASAGGLPAGLKAGTESLSGVAMDDVQVHRDSPRPAEFGALAYAQGSDIHLGPGQEEHLPHEAWHTAQQKQGRVAADTQAKGVAVNEDEALETEADEMGAKAASVGDAGPDAAATGPAGKDAAAAGAAGKDAAAGGAASETAAPTGGGGGGGEQEGAEIEAEGEASMGGEVVQAKAAPGGIVQRVKKKGVVIDIASLTADQCKEHISRAFRIKAGKGGGDDADYEYASDDVANLNARQKALKDADLAAKWSALTTALAGALAGMATAADFVAAPPWIGQVTTGSEGSEANKAGNMAADAATVTAAWAAFLGAGPYSNKHPRTGVPAAGRLVSGDGKRSIRYGNHEQVKTGANGHHYHEETWTWDGVSAVTVANMVQKVPVT